MRLIHQGLGDFAIQVRQADVEASLEKVSAAGYARVHFSVDGQLSQEGNVHLPGRNPHRSFEAGRPICSEQLLRIGADACGAGRRQFDVQVAIRTAGRTVLATGGAGFGDVDHFARWALAGSLTSWIMAGSI